MPNKPRQHRPFAKAKGGQRPTSAKRGYDTRWQRYREVFLTQHPLCVLCAAAGRVEPATVVDHIRAVSGPDDPGFYDEQNHRPLCKSCHSKKTNAQDGGGWQG